MADKKIAILKNPRSHMAEMYRILRTNVQFASVDKNVKTILITSPGPNEGKSFTAANLAVAFAQSGQSVILVDCDLRKPCQHKIWELENMRGLSNIIIENEEIGGYLQQTPVDNLKIITTGPIPPNPSEILVSQKMSNLISNLRSYADVILLDTPPVVAVTDTALLAPQVDGVILVIGSGIAKIETSQRAKEMLINGKARILGTVLNLTDDHDPDYYY